MAVPTIALYASPPGSVCSTPYPCQINTHSSSDLDINSRPSSSASTQKPIVGGLSCLFSSTSVRHASPSSTFAVDDLGSLWHDRSEDFGSSFSYSTYSSLGSSIKCRDQSPVSVFQGPVSCSASSSSRSPPTRCIRDRNGDLHPQASFRANRDGLFNGFVRNALGSCLDYDSSSFPLPGGSVERNGEESSVSLVDEFTFTMEGTFSDSCGPYGTELLVGAQARHKIFYDEFVVEAFYEAEKAHKGQVAYGLKTCYELLF